MEQDEDDPANLLALPPELIDHILSFLSPYDLTRTSKTCRKFLEHARKDFLWQNFIQRNVAVELTTPGPCTSFRQLFINHHPRWFLTRRKIWFSDYGHGGKLIIARFDPRRGCIEAYAIGAERGPNRHSSLDWDGQVSYHTFNPKVRLDLNRPLIHLQLVSEEERSQRFVSEIPMSDTNSINRLTSTFNHTRVMPQGPASSNASLWPPATIPSPNNQRTRNTSQNAFDSLGHVPSRLAEASDATFRIREWVEFSRFMPIQNGGTRVAEIVSTYGTLDEECYKPTKEKPWQGIWCGDYSGHGCEFLAIMQPDNPRPLPDKVRKAFGLWPHTDVDFFGGPLDQEDDDDDGIEDEEDDSTDGHWVGGDVAPTNASAAQRFLRGRRNTMEQKMPEDVAPYKGRLEAVKLTGDPNIPRGEITFIAEDIGENGLVGFAQEPVFNPDAFETCSNGTDGESSASTTGPSKTCRLPPDARGAHIVKAVGHIANQGFTHDEWVPTQLIMINENRMAQYWRHFGYVSFYERVDIEQFLVP